jgi:tRNA G26 N,N-dimethylase Trm1
VEPLWDKEFCARLIIESKRKNLRNKIRILGMLSLISREIHAPITYYVIDKLCDKFNLPVPSLSRVIDELTRGGFLAVATHFSSKAVRTNAPAAILKESVVKSAQFSGTSCEKQYKTAN